MSRRAAPFLVVAAALLATSCSAPAPAEFTLVGSFQADVGCTAEWDTACGATGMRPDGARQSVRLDLPAGHHEFKVARTGSWDENWGAGGAQGGANIPLSLTAPAEVLFTFDPATHDLGGRRAAASTWVVVG